MNFQLTLRRALKRLPIVTLSLIFALSVANAQGLGDLAGSEDELPSSSVPGSSGSMLGGNTETQSCGVTGLDECGSGANEDAGAASSGIQPRAHVGNPINLMTGNKSQSESDFVIVGSALRFVRVYNSANEKINNKLGYGWHHSYSLTLSDAGNGRRELVQSNGSGIVFDDAGKDGNGHPLYRTPFPSQGYLRFDGKHHIWHLPDGRELRFFGRFLVSINWPDQRELVLYYHSRRLNSVTDETGRVIRFDYYPGNSNAGLLNQYKEQRFGEAPGHISQITLPDGSTLHYDYDHRNNLTRVRSDDGTSREYHYENETYQNHLTGLTDRTGVRFASWSYDSEGRAVSSEHAGGVEKVTLQYPDVAQVASGEHVQTLVTDSLGAQSEYIWQRVPGGKGGQLLSSNGPGCTSCPQTGVNYDYDANGRLIQASNNREGNTPDIGDRRFEYDSQGRLLSIHRVDSLGVVQLVRRMEYSSLGFRGPDRTYLPSVNPDGERSVEVQRDSSGLPVRVIERGWSPTGTDFPSAGYTAIEREVQFRYQGEKLIEIDGPRDDVDDTTRLYWDTAQRLSRIEQPGAPPMQLREVDQLGRVTQFQSGGESPVMLRYDSTSQRVNEVIHRGRTLRFHYDANGRLTSYTSPDGQRQQLVYDDAGRIIELVDAHGRRTRFEQNSEGLRTRSQSFAADGSLIGSVSLLYDTLGRVNVSSMLMYSTAGGNQVEVLLRQYDPQGRLSLVENTTSGSQIRVGYSPLGQLAEVMDIQPVETDENENGQAGVSAEIQTVGFSYDSAGNEVVVTDARGNRTVTLQDDFGRVVVLNSQDTGITRYQYDTANNRIEKILPSGDSVRYTWDAANRMSGKFRPDGDYYYHYSVQNGRLIESVAPSTTERFEYDIESRLIHHERKIDGRRFSTGYEYDANGRLSRKELPDGQTLRYHYRDDVMGVERGSLRAVTRETLLGLSQEALLSEIDQNPVDGSTGWVHHNGLQLDKSYAANGQLMSLAVSQAMQLRYSYDSSGRITGIDVDGTLQRYRYNASGLSHAELNGITYSYEYDLVGNRTLKTVEQANGAVESSEYHYGEPGTGNHLLKTETLTAESQSGDLIQHGSEFSYNPDGTPAIRDNFQYEYDAEQRPVRVYEDGSLLAEYRYNGFGERIKKVVYGNHETLVSYYLYDGNTLTAEIDGRDSQSSIRHGIFLDGTLVSYLVGQNVYAVHSDHLGTPKQLSNAHGEKVWAADYTPFGKATLTTDTLSQPYRFPGQYYDAETGAHYNYYRDYDPATGRYITSDPIGLKGGFNTYAYALNNPVELIDRLGLNVSLDSQFTENSPPKPIADENSYLKKLEKVFDYALAELGDVTGEDVVGSFLNNLKDSLPVLVGMVVAVAAFPAALPLVYIGGWLVSGYSAGVFIRDLIGTLIDLNNIDICDDTQLQSKASSLLSSFGTVVQDISTNVLLGGLGKISSVLSDAASYAGKGVWTVWQKLRSKFDELYGQSERCSFAGETLVLTREGFIPIKDIVPDKTLVWSRSDSTNEAGWRRVVGKFKSYYTETVWLTSEGESGQKQTIKSSRVHPFFARLAAATLLTSNGALALSTEGYVYDGDIGGGIWIDAQQLASEDELLDQNDQWQRVIDVSITPEPLIAYNLSVDDYATFYVAGNSDAAAVWVHNDCSVKFSDDFSFSSEYTNHGHPIFLDNEEHRWFRGNDGWFYDMRVYTPKRNGIDGPKIVNQYANQFPTNPRNVYKQDGQVFGKEGSGAVLRKNMSHVGFREPPDSAAHHIVASGDTRHPEAVRARELMAEISPPFDVNEAANGVFLPRFVEHAGEEAPPHSRIHTEVYYTELVQRLERVPASGRRTVVRKIAAELAANTFPW